MPEEINRIISDHLSYILFCPTKTAVKNLNNEGLFKNVYMVGDIMYDSAIFYSDIAKSYSKILNKIGLIKNKYVLLTLHRQENTDNFEIISNIIEALVNISTNHNIIFPIHPRTKKKLIHFELFQKIKNQKNIHIISPVSYFDMLILQKSSKFIMTDSGGVQKEAYFNNRPCITLRNETEWMETVEKGWNQVVGTQKKIF